MAWWIGDWISFSRVWLGWDGVESEDGGGGPDISGEEVGAGKHFVGDITMLDNLLAHYM